MNRIQRSLLLRLILAFWAVSLAGILIVALLAGRVSSLEFNRFVSESQYQSLIDSLAQYYSAHGSFEGALPLLESARSQAQPGQAHEFLLLDAQDELIYSLSERALPGKPSPELASLGFAIMLDNQLVGRLLPLRAPRGLDEMAAGNLRRINSSLVTGALFATGLALLAGWLMARNITRPLRELNAAAQAIARGHLENKVKVASRDEIGTLALSFNQMSSSLQQARDLRRQMTADIAHELRNPLSIIMGNAEALSEGLLPATPEALAIIYDESRHLSHLVDDLRTLSLSESGELQLERSACAVDELLQHSAAAFALRAAEKHIQLQLDCPAGLPALWADANRLEQVLANLLDNSLKHTPPGGVIRLSAAQAGVGQLQLLVSDSGPGISSAELPLVFERFYRGKSAPGRLQDGSGLGLAICKALVQLHGGRISVSSPAGQGAQISIVLPTS